ncbi:MAG: hypothetical protein CMF42_04410 [Legionellales bacterium]|nr:hypothetical protein [Legionellales bacterium]
MKKDILKCMKICNDYIMQSRIQLLQQLLQKASRLCCQCYQDQIEITYKEDHQPVTNIDQSINDLIRTQMNAQYPYDGWFSEEDEGQRLDATFTWILDPIDGTRQMIQRIPEFCIALALMKNQKLIASGVVNPMTQESWLSDPSKAVYDLEHKAHRLIYNPNAPRLISHQFSFDHSMHMGSIAYRMCKVIQGDGVAAISNREIALWDVAAAIHITLNTGLVVTDIHGDSVSFDSFDRKVNGIVVAHVENHRKIIEEIGQRRI